MARQKRVKKKTSEVKKPRKKYHYLIPNLRFFLISVLIFINFDKLKPVFSDIQFGNLRPEQFTNAMWLLAIGAVFISTYHLFRSIWKGQR